MENSPLVFCPAINPDTGQTTLWLESNSFWFQVQYYGNGFFFSGWSRSFFTGPDGKLYSRFNFIEEFADIPYLKSSDPLPVN